VPRTRPQIDSEVRMAVRLAGRAQNGEVRAAGDKQPTPAIPNSASALSFSSAPETLWTSGKG